MYFLLQTGMDRRSEPTGDRPFHVEEYAGRRVASLHEGDFLYFENQPTTIDAELAVASAVAGLSLNPSDVGRCYQADDGTSTIADSCSSLQEDARPALRMTGARYMLVPETTNSSEQAEA